MTVMKAIFTTDDSIVVVRGGTQQPHREYSMRSGANVYHSLRKENKVFDIHLQSSGSFEYKGKKVSIHRILQSNALVFNALHGDTAGHFQRLCRKHGARHTGSSHATHKSVTTTHTKRRILRRQNLDVIPHWRLTREGTKADDAVYTAVLKEITYPVVIEPLPDSFSANKIVARSEDELVSVLRSVFSKRSTVYVSPAKTGRVFSVLVLERFRNQTPYTFPVHEIKYDHPAANASDLTKEENKVVIATPENTQAIEQAAAQTFTAGSLCSVGRVDILQTTTGENHILNVKAYPRLDRHSLLHDSAQAVGATMNEVLAAIVSSARTSSSTLK